MTEERSKAEIPSALRCRDETDSPCGNFMIRTLNECPFLFFGELYYQVQQEKKNGITVFRLYRSIRFIEGTPVSVFFALLLYTPQAKGGLFRRDGQFVFSDQRFH